MVKISKARVDLESARLEQAVLKDYAETVVSVEASATTTLNLSSGNTFDLLHDATITSLLITNIPGNAASITIIRTKDNSDVMRTISWPGNFSWAGGTEPTLSQVSGETDIITAVTKNGGFFWYASAVTAFQTRFSSRLFTWGVNESGAIGDGSITNRSSPVQIGTMADWFAISSGAHMLATRTGGSLWSWGAALEGRLGDGQTAANRSSPVQVGTLLDWAKVRANLNHSLAIKTDGTLWAWGLNNAGRLGDGTTTSRSSPVQVGQLGDWSSLAGGGHSLALKTDGTLWAWGSGVYGRTGDGTTDARSSPVQIGTLTSWSIVSAGNSHSLAVKTDGSLWAWGTASSGRVGDGQTAANRSSPVQIGTLLAWATVAGGAAHSLAVKTDGSLWAWGLAASGQLGDGQTAANRSSPVQIGTLLTWATVAGSYSHSFATKTDGTLWSWGIGSSGQLGDGTTAPKSSPVQVGTVASWTRVGTVPGGAAGGGQAFLNVTS